MWRAVCPSYLTAHVAPFTRACPPFLLPWSWLGPFVPHVGLRVPPPAARATRAFPKRKRPASFLAGRFVGAVTAGDQWCLLSSITGRVSNWWYGGGEDSVHSNVVAPSPQGLSGAFLPAASDQIRLMKKITMPSAMIS